LGLGTFGIGRSAAAFAAVFTLLLASPAAPSGAHGHTHRGAPARQLRGAMVTPNWSIAGSPFLRSADQQRAEIQDVCRMGGDLIRLHVDWSQLQPGEYQPTPAPAGPPGGLPLPIVPLPMARANELATEPEGQPRAAPPSTYEQDARLAGDYDAGYLHRLDQVMSWAAACHIRVIADLVGSPCWSIDPAPCDDSTWVFDPPAAGRFGAVTRFLLNRYPRLYALEIWNEPNNSFWKGSPSGYAALVEEAVDARNAIRSRTKILAGALLGDGSDYLEQLYDAGMHGQDGISIHPYSITCSTSCGPFINPTLSRSPFREAITAAHRVMRLHHDSGGIYLTEFGFSTCPAQPFCLQERTAGRWLSLSLRIAARYPYVRGLTIFSMRDFAERAEASPRWDMRSGILRADLTPKPAFRMVKQELSRLRGSRR
jgi:hypothetical protein